MNFYPHHIGDYAEATAHLTFAEDGAYSRLIRKYYSTEKALPADLKTVQRLVVARSKEEKEAVETVLNEFFELREDGWHNSRCDAEIEKFKEEEPLRLQKEENIKERKRRYNERRKAMFDALRELGIVPAWDIKMPELERLHAQHCERNQNAPRTSKERTKERTTDENGTATQHHNHNHNQISKHTTPIPQPLYEVGTAAGAVCLALRGLGVQRTNPSHEKLHELLRQGFTVDDFVKAAAGHDDPGVKAPFAWVLGKVVGQRNAAANEQNTGAKHATTSTERSAATLAEALPPRATEPYTIDIDAKPVPDC